MADLWSHQFCLACDKQVESDSAAYCSESCRLTELEKDSTPSSQVSSPGLTPPSYPWTSTSSQNSNAKLTLSPPFDFANAQRYYSTPVQQRSLFGSYTMGSEQTKRTLTPSSSHTSLCSMQSTSSAGEASHLSDRATKELRAYAVSFEHVNSQRRRSY